MQIVRNTPTRPPGPGPGVVQAVPAMVTSGLPWARVWIDPEAEFGHWVALISK